MKRARNGTGSLYRQGHTWWMQYYVNGERHQRSTGTTDKQEARRVLNERLGRVATGDPVIEDRAAGSVTFEQAVRRLKDEDIIKGLITRDQRQQSIQRHLAPVFGRRPLAAITTDKIRAYQAARLKAGAAISTINGELSTLHRLFELAVQDGDYRGLVPHFTFPVPKNARKGFFDRAQFDAVCRHLPDWAIGPFTFAYLTGWRCNSEVLPLEWRHIDTETGEVMLETSKNGKGRTFPYTLLPELVKTLAAAQRVRERLQHQGVIVPYVFHREGEPLFYPATPPRRFGTFKRWLREAWEDACRLAGVPGKVPHDFRRTAARNLVRAGISTKTAMQITGHESFAIFTRYDVVDQRDIESAVAQLAQWMATQAAPTRPRRR